MADGNALTSIMRFGCARRWVAVSGDR